MRKIFLALFATLFYYSSNCQIIINTGNNLLTDENFFNPQFIKTNNIEYITGKIAVKKSLQPITNLGTIIQYRFTKSGLLMEKTETLKHGSLQPDTTLISFKYDDINRLIEKTNLQVEAYATILYHYDAKSNVSKLSHYRGKNLAQNNYELNKGKSYLVKTDDFLIDYLENGSIKKTFLNNEGKPYKETLIEFDTLGNKILEQTKFTVTNRRETIKFSYNDFGKLHQIETTSNLTTPVKIVYQYAYDELGNLYEEQKIKNNVLVQRRQFLYDSTSMLLSAELIKNEQTQEITIIQYDYTFFENTSKTENP